MARRGCRDCPEEDFRPAQQGDLDRELSFHYERSEREDSRRRPLPDHSRSTIFRGNRSLMILALDVFIVVIIGVIYVFFLRSDPAEASLRGNDFLLEVTEFSEGTLLSLEVVGGSAGGDSDSSAPAGSVGALFQFRLLYPAPEELLGRLDTASTELPSDLRRLLNGGWVFDLLPGAEGAPRTVRLLFPFGIEAESLRLEVGIEEEFATLEAEITREL